MTDLEAKLVIVTICCPTIFCIIQPIGDISIVQLSQRLLLTLAPRFYSLVIGDIAHLESSSLTLHNIIGTSQKIYNSMYCKGL